ncbi:MAG: hypothetical protein B6D56_02270 [Candidatus Omnitrophica bacterium 4484_70.1]|nr:MAG: hypothetical protein B6D56_02270 [Candidatus Omnitrophica bacterium 4484_70.1]
MIKVKLLSFTKEAKKILYASARQCYSKESAYRIYKKERVPPKKLEKFIAHLIEKRHLSPLEHINFTFSIEGISRVCTHQLVRHRIASYSQQSQRYVDLEDFRIIIPPLIEKNKKAKKIFLQTIDYLRKQYKLLKEILTKDKELTKEEINQDIRFLLPQATETKIVVTMNARQLLHFFSERLCLRAQWEIRNLANLILKECRKVLPEVFNFAGPKCKVLKYCPEKNTKCPLYPKS